MRMPPNSTSCVIAASAGSSFNGGRHAHAAESRTGRSTRPMCAPFNGGRHAHAAESGVAAGSRVGILLPSMEGGMRMPPNRGTRPGSPS